MNELLHSCSDALPQPTTPCPGDYGERIVTIAISKTMLWQDVPTALDLNTAWTAGSLMLIENIVNGHRTFISSQEIEVIHKEQVDKLYRIEGRTRRLDEAMTRAFEKLDRYAVLYLWFITEKNWCFGGYEVTPNFSHRIIEGKGIPVYIAFDFGYIDLGIDLAAFDEEYENIPEDIDIYVAGMDGNVLTGMDGETIIPME